MVSIPPRASALMVCLPLQNSSSYLSILRSCRQHAGRCRTPTENRRQVEQIESRSARIVVQAELELAASVVTLVPKSLIIQPWQYF
jgi:hypothetical protein